MGATRKDFQASGSAPSRRDCLEIMYRRAVNAVAQDFSSCGCRSFCLIAAFGSRVLKVAPNVHLSRTEADFGVSYHIAGGGGGGGSWSGCDMNTREGIQKAICHLSS